MSKFYIYKDCSESFFHSLSDLPGQVHVDGRSHHHITLFGGPSSCAGSVVGAKGKRKERKTNQMNTTTATVASVQATAVMETVQVKVPVRSHDHFLRHFFTLKK